MAWLVNKDKRALVAWLWLLVPPLAAIALQVGISAYCRHTRALLDWRLSLAQVVPDMAAQLAVARKETATFLLPPGQSDSIVETLGTKLHNLVQPDGFHIDSLSVEKGGVVNGMSLFHVALNGGGDVPATARLLHAVQTAEHLMSVDYVRLHPHRDGDERNYNVELSFQYLVIPP
jgi:hypothetical protein